MTRALKLAEKGRGLVEPNPLVGCVIARGANILGEGFHRRYGGPHAEVAALRRCSKSPAGATAYVTLEPCAHHGKTPPCVEALIRAEVARVVVATGDPFPAVAGRGVRRLRAAGMQVDVGLARKEAREVNAPYFTLTQQARPYVILKWAQSLDGKIATRTGESKWITSAPARREVHRLRGRVDGILIGVGTVLADDPSLTCRYVRPRRTATRVVLDSRLRTPARAQLIQTAHRVPTLVVTLKDAMHQHVQRVRRLESHGCEVLGIDGKDGRVDLQALVNHLGQRRWTNLLVEGGSGVLGAFVDAGLVDDVYVFVAPRLIGGAGAPGPLGGKGPASLNHKPRFVVVETHRLGSDWLYRLRAKP